MSKQDGVQEYLRRVSQHLEYPRSQKKVMLQEIKDIVLDIPGAESMSLTELIEAAGDPDDLAASYQDAMDLENIKKAVKRHFYVRLVVLGCLVVTLGLILFFVVDSYLYNHGVFNNESIVSGVYSPPTESGILIDYYSTQ